jgi:hypothetical protein
MVSIKKNKNRQRILKFIRKNLIYPQGAAMLGDIISNFSSLSIFKFDMYFKSI